MSTRPYPKFSGMTTASLTPANDGTTKAFDAVTAADQVGTSQASEGDIYRAIVNEDDTAILYLGETAAHANSGGVALMPGQRFELLGPSGAGWAGDLYVKGDASAKCSTIRF